MKLNLFFLQNLGIFCKSRDFLQISGFFANLGIFCKSRDFLQISGFFANLGIFCKSRDFTKCVFSRDFFFLNSREFLQKPGFYKVFFSRDFLRSFFLNADTETNLICCIRIQCGYTNYESNKSP